MEENKRKNFLNEDENYKLLKGDCLKLMSLIPDKSIDMILCDLPYGTTNCKWDTIIPFDELWEQYERIIKDDGAIVLFAAQPFTSKLISSNIKNFKYCWYWEKNIATGFPFAKKQPLRAMEDIAVFYKKAPNYYPQGLIKLEKPLKQRRKQGNQGGVYRSGGLVEKEYYKTHTNYPKNILKFNVQREGLHPTQKPVNLLEYLIKTYTKERDLILDNCMGSGSTGEACLNTNRKFIGMELEEEIFDIAYNRINGYIYE